MNSECTRVPWCAFGRWKTKKSIRANSLQAVGADDRSISILCLRQKRIPIRNYDVTQSSNALEPVPGPFTYTTRAIVYRQQWKMEWKFGFVYGVNEWNYSQFCSLKHFVMPAAWLPLRRATRWHRTQHKWLIFRRGSNIFRVFGFPSDSRYLRCSFAASIVSGECRCESTHNFPYLASISSLIALS